MYVRNNFFTFYKIVINRSLDPIECSDSSRFFSWNPPSLEDVSPHLECPAAPGIPAGLYAAPWPWPNVFIYLSCHISLAIKAVSKVVQPIRPMKFSRYYAWTTDVYRFRGYTRKGPHCLGEDKAIIMGNDDVNLVIFLLYNYMEEQKIMNHAVENSARMAMCVWHTQHTQLLYFVLYWTLNNLEPETAIPKIATLLTQDKSNQQ